MINDIKDFHETEIVDEQFESFVKIYSYFR